MSIKCIFCLKEIIKIIYEMTCYWLGEEYLSDSIGETLREYIFSKELEIKCLNGFVGLVGEKDFKFIARIPDDDSHTAILIRDSEKLLCYVNVMNIFEGGMIVTEQADKYHLGNQQGLRRILRSRISSKEVTEEGC